MVAVDPLSDYRLDQKHAKLHLGSPMVLIPGQFERIMKNKRTNGPIKVHLRPEIYTN